MTIFRLLIWLLLVGAVLPARAESVRICVQNIDYYPHYDFSDLPGRGYAADLFALFTAKTGVKIILLSLPVKRLQDNPDCQLVYPDNPQWHSAKGEPQPLYFSQSFTGIIGSTVVRRGEGDTELSAIRSIAIPRGFTPDHLLAVQQNYSFNLVEVSDATAALQMLLKKRVDAADVEWHVARHLLNKLGQPDAVEIGRWLPLASVGFHLSSRDHGDLLRRFDLFLLQYQSEIALLKTRYQLQTVEQLKINIAEPSAPAH
ncbi:hypothetical protein [Rheinheimera sp. F8]|uniref:hypothetical protein n=1 Tax=Rheinheimera sp. F8 TaxID=1763998 RepID=UPI000744CF8D|nr:hypothetical protein [Rheinheimera sp. F8]ALZ75231.1 hypothetical protein ATY27_05315 [Rheinheimera sp. F8]ALZ76344.1 hypothetical protein ATY27_11635 [Rheinheimera sp. F8]